MEISMYRRKCMDRVRNDSCPSIKLRPKCCAHVCTVHRSNSIFIVIRARFPLNYYSDTNKTDTRPQRNTCKMVEMVVETFDSRDLGELSIAKSNRFFMVSSTIFISSTRIKCTQNGRWVLRQQHTHHHILFITFEEMTENREHFDL